LPAVTTQEALDLFRSTGALLEGHFVLRSGLHSRQFFQCALALQQMPIVERFGAALAAKLRPLGATTVISPAMGGLVIGQEVARQLGLRFIFAEKEDGKLVLRRKPSPSSANSAAWSPASQWSWTARTAAWTSACRCSA
jgi:orotate phosphoribosyltransferase